MHVNPIANLREDLVASGPTDEVVVRTQDLMPLERLLYQDPDTPETRTACILSIHWLLSRNRLEEMLAHFGRVLAVTGWTLDEFAALPTRDIAGTLGYIFAAHVRGLPRRYYEETAQYGPCGPHCPGWEKNDWRSELYEG